MTFLKYTALVNSHNYGCGCIMYILKWYVTISNDKRLCLLYLFSCFKKFERIQRGSDFSPTPLGGPAPAVCKKTLAATIPKVHF